MEIISIEIEKREKRIIIDVRENFKHKENKQCTMSLTIEDLTDFTQIGRALKIFGEKIIQTSIECDKCTIEDSHRKKMIEASYKKGKCYE